MSRAWFVVHGESKTGPYSAVELKAMAAGDIRTKQQTRNYFFTFSSGL